MNREFAHLLTFTVEVKSALKSGKDITFDQIAERLAKDWSLMEEDVLDTKITVLLPISQESFRNEPDHCPRCGHTDSVNLDWKFEGNCVYHNRRCNKCDAGWTSCFEAKNYSSHDD